MSDNLDEKLESMLRSRHVEAPDPDLAGKIILNARGIPQIENISFWQLVRDLCAEFHLPKPAYVLASALALGLVLGFNMPSDSQRLEEGNGSNLQGFFSADEELL